MSSGSGGLGDPRSEYANKGTGHGSSAMPGVRWPSKRESSVLWTYYLIGYVVEYALRAFDAHAVDYLLKPFDRTRFREALERAISQIKLKRSSELNARLLRLVNDYQREQQDYLTSFCIKEAGRLVTVSASEVYWVEANGNYVALHLHAKSYLYRSTMNVLASELDPDDFVRVHRSYLVNTIFIKEINYLGANEYLFVLRNGEKLTSSRSYKTKIEDLLNQIHVR
jgi:two-component system LytT family response regulator